MTVEKKLSGWLVITDIINGQLVTEKYQGYTKAEAKQKFKEKYMDAYTFSPNELVILKITDPEDAALNNKVGRITAPFAGLPCQPNALGVYLLDKDVYGGKINVLQNELVSWGERFAFICRVHGVTRKKDIRLLQEAYRRNFMFHPNEPLETSWCGLGTPAQYRTKNHLFKTTDGSQFARVNHWWQLTESGLEVMKHLLAELPVPSTPEGRTDLNNILYGRT